MGTASLRSGITSVRARTAVDFAVPFAFYEYLPKQDL